MDEVQTLALEMFHDYLEVGWLTDAVEILYRLTFMGCFPMKELSEIFTVDFLGKLDKYGDGECDLFLRTRW